MKTINKFIAFFVFALLAFTAKTSFAAVVWNGGPNDCTQYHPAVGIKLSVSTGGTNGCLPYQQSISASRGQSVSVQVWFHNNGNTDANNVTIRVTPNGDKNTITFNGGLTTSNGPSITGYPTLTIPANTKIVPSGANYVLTTTNSTSVNTNTVINGGFNIGTVRAGAQGALAISFNVVDDTPAPTYVCSDGQDNDGDGKSDNFDPGCYENGQYVPTKNSEVDAYVPQPTRCSVNISASPNNIMQGQGSTVSWSSSNCTTVNDPFGGRASSGSYYVSPGSTTTYTINGSNQYNSDSANTQVVVNQPQRPQCSVSIYANPSSIQQGGQTNVVWNSSNCDRVEIWPNIGSNKPLSGSQFDTPSVSTTYTITGYGFNTATANTVVSVGPAPARPICSDNIDNDGDGKTDQADPGCYENGQYAPNRMSEYDAPVLSGPTVSTGVATGVTTNTCKFNSIVRINSPATTSAYFKYGTSQSNLSFTTPQSTIGTNTGGYQFADTVGSLRSGTTYYYKVVATNQYGTREDSVVRSCTTRSNTVTVREPDTVVTRTVVQQPVVRQITTVAQPAERIIANSAPSLLFLRIDDRREDLTCGDVVDYQVVYKNVSNITLERAVLEVQLPTGVRYVKSSSGGSYSPSTKTVTFNIGTVLPSQEDAKFIQADVICEEVDSDMLVANALMSYTNPTTNAQEDAAAYDLDKFFIVSVDGRTNLAGAAIFGSGFFPNSLIGWLILILILIGLIYLVRLFLLPVRRKETTIIHNTNKDSNPPSFTIQS